MSNTILVILLIVIIALASVAAYGFLRPIEPETEVTIKTLEEAAKLEGEVTVYSSIDIPDFENVIAPAFEDLYPWATVTHIGLPPGEAFTRVTSEYLADQVICDAWISGSFANHYLLYDEGAVKPFIDDNVMLDLMAYPEITKDPKKVSQVLYVLPNVLGYNTELVTAQEAPQSYEDLTDPRWDGEIVMDSPSQLIVSGFLFAALYPGMTDATWTALMEGIAANNPILTTSSSDAFQKLATGEASVGIIQLNDYLAGKKEGLPIEAIWAEPTIGNPVCMAMPTDAPHPNMAMLFVQWFTSAAGQFAMAETGRTPAHPSTAAATVLAGVVPAGVEIVTPVNEDYNENPEAWSTKYVNIFGS